MSTATTQEQEQVPADDGRRAGRNSTGKVTGWRQRLSRFVPPRLRRSTAKDAVPATGRSGRRRWPWITALVLAVALLAGAGYAVFVSPLLGLTSVSITGASDELTAQVRSAVQIPDGTPLARIDLDQVAADVEAVPEVFEVEVARGWPDTLTIAITPRLPIAVTSANGQFWLLDKTGDPYLAVTAPPAGLTTVQLVAPGTGDPATMAALTVAEALTPDFRPQVTQLSARTAFDVELTLTDGKKVLWGEATQSAEKMQILPALLAAQDGSQYDVTDPTLVSVR